MFELNTRYEGNVRNINNEVNNFRSENRASNFIVMRGDVYLANLGEARGNIQGSERPILVVSNNACNKYSPVITVVPLTSQLHKKKLPTHTLISTDCGLRVDSIALVEGMTSLNKSDLISKIGHCNDKEMTEIEKAIQIQNGIQPKETNETQIRQERRYYSANEKFQSEVFDIYRAKRMVKTINELENFIIQMQGINVPINDTIRDSVDIHISELKFYCEKFNKDYKLFYKPIINKINEYKGEVVNG